MLVKTMLNNYGDKTVLSPLTSEQEEQLKRMLLEMCVDIMSFCDKHGLVCTLGGGTALGAIRHKGFIPWDDDIDLNMPRKDYDRFIPLFAKEFEGKYEVYAPDGVRLATTLFTKIAIPGTILEDIFHAGDPIKLGVNIDIFPIENVPDNKLLRTIKGFFCDAFSKIVVSVYYYQCRSEKMKSLFYGSVKTRILYDARCLVGFLLSWKSYQWWFAKYDRVVQTKKESNLVTIPTGQKHYLGEMMERSTIFPLKKAEFEGKEFNVYGKVEEYLSLLYGNYMELPPPEKREKHFYTNVKL